MATDATTRVITASTPSGRASARRFGNRAARVVALGLVGLMTAVTAFASLRLAAVVSATPPATWLAAVPLPVDPAHRGDPQAAGRAAAVANVIADPLLFGPQSAACDSQEAASLAACERALDAALSAAPASGQLWLFKARLLAFNGRYDEPTLTALRNSYRFAPREGWIAADRVVLGLTLYPLLPADLRSQVVGDLHLVLSLPESFTDPLTAAYAANQHLRVAADDALHLLSADDLNRFVARVRRQLNG
ncbi:MAG TPA: hypothetical protein VG894_09790 [Bauldia sp.]|nr:hypothetical protein [Bauldia sp.]